MEANSSGARDADISTLRSVAGIVLLVGPLAAGLVSAQLVDNTTTALVIGATPFVIVELIEKVLDFVLHGNETDDWFAALFDQVRVPAALVSGSYVAGTLAGEHTLPALIGGVALIVLLTVVRFIHYGFRRRAAS